MLAIIYNPVSGGGRGKTLAEKAEALLHARGEEYKVFATRCDGDGAEQAKQAMADGCLAMIAIGGDGTISEIVSVVAGTDAELIFVPGGTGNDFVRVLGLPKDPMEALAAQLDGVPARVDSISVNGRPFLNVSGSGFDVDVLRKTEELKAVYPGPRAYRKAVASVLASYQPLEAELTLDGGETQRIRAAICEFANGQYFGGGMRVAPESVCNDGLIDVVIVRKVPGFMIPFLLPLLILGVHTKTPIAKRLTVRHAVMKSPGMTINIDGRLVPGDVAEYQILPGALRIRKPKA